MIQPIDYLVPPEHLSFAQIGAVSIPCYSIYQHIAEKVHAIWRPRAVQSSRVKDLVDLVLIANLASDIKADTLYEAMFLIFKKRGAQLPATFETFPPDWKQRYIRLAKEIDLSILDFQDATQAISSFISPVLSGDVAGKVWDAISWEWKLNA